MPSVFDIENAEHDPALGAKKVSVLNNDPLASYKDAGMDVASNPMYFGFIDITGAWYIKKLDTESGSTYCNGDSDYPTAWEGRAGLTYGLFNEIF